MRRATALAIAVIGLAGADWPDVSAPLPRESGGGDDVALIVAVEDYDKVPDVPGAVANAEAWRDYLIDVRGLKPASVAVLTDGDATRPQIMQEAARLAETRLGAGRVWFVFVGHGSPSMDGSGDGRMLAVDVQQKAATLDYYSVGRRELVELLEPARPEMIAVIDACFSGAFADGSAKIEGQPLRPVDERIGARATVLGAARSDQIAGALPGMGRPAFSWLVLGAMRGWGDEDSDGSITAGEAVRWSGGVIATVAKDRRQTPTLEAAVGDGAVLAAPRSPEAAPDFRALGAAGPDGQLDRAVESRGEVGNSDLAGLAQQLAAARKLETDLATQRTFELDAQKAALLALATTDGEAGREVVAGGGAPAAAFASAFVEKWEDAAAVVTDPVGTVREPVEIPQLAEARATLEPGRRKKEPRADAAVPAPVSSDGTIRTNLDVAGAAERGGHVLVQLGLPSAIVAEYRLRSGLLASFGLGAGANVGSGTGPQGIAGPWAVIDLRVARPVQLEVLAGYAFIGHSMKTGTGGMNPVFGAAIQFDPDDRWYQVNAGAQAGGDWYWIIGPFVNFGIDLL